MSLSNNETFFPSEANLVSLHSKNGRKYVKKQYLSKLKSYPVYWPLGRAEVEVFLLGFLSDRLKGKKIYVPTIYSFSKPDTLEMEYCVGTPLLEASIEQLCEEINWQQFFSFLYQLAEVSIEEFSPAIDKTLKEQQIIFDCMKHWKFQDYINPPDNSYGCLVLGDMSLSNILCSTRGLTLLDFECAHWGYYGYDIGQILGMLEVYHHNVKLETILSQALEETIPDSFYLNCCLYWKRRFVSYYRSKRQIDIQNIEK